MRSEYSEDLNSLISMRKIYWSPYTILSYNNYKWYSHLHPPPPLRPCKWHPSRTNDMRGVKNPHSNMNVGLTNCTGAVLSTEGWERGKWSKLDIFTPSPRMVQRTMMSTKPTFGDILWDQTQLLSKRIHSNWTNPSFSVNVNYRSS